PHLCDRRPSGAVGRAGRPLGHGAGRARAADAGRSRSIAFGDAARTPGRALSISPAGPGPPDAAALALLPPPADRPWLADPQAGHRRRLGGPGLGRREPSAVFATLAHIRGDTADLARLVDQAFPGARLSLPYPGRTATFGVVFPDLPQRVFEASELSDGTLKFLALAGALLAYRLPPFIALNEPESSLHPDLM